MANVQAENRNQTASPSGSPERRVGPRCPAGTAGVAAQESTKPCVDNVGKLCPCLVAAEFLLHLVSTQSKLCSWLTQEGHSGNSW